jgi:hypothetical protein
VGASAVLAGVSLLVASGLLIVFFVTENETADRASNWAFTGFYAFMAWTVVEVHRFYVDEAGWVWAATIVALVVLAFLFVAQLAIVLGRVDFRSVAIATTVGFVVILLWMLATSVVIITQGGLPEALGWFGVGVITLSVVVIGASAIDRELILGEKTPGPVMNALYGLVLVGLTAWLIWLGLAPPGA